MDGGRRREDAARLADELRAAGAPQEKIDEVERDDETIEVLAPNWDAFCVWRLCQPVVLAMGGTYGVTALEIRLVAHAQRVRFTADLIARVRLMAGAADEWRSDHAKD